MHRTTGGQPKVLLDSVWSSREKGASLKRLLFSFDVDTQTLHQVALANWDESIDTRWRSAHPMQCISTGRHPRPEWRPPGLTARENQYAECTSSPRSCGPALIFHKEADGLCMFLWRSIRGSHSGNPDTLATAQLTEWADLAWPGLTRPSSTASLWFGGENKTRSKSPFNHYENWYYKCIHSDRHSCQMCKTKKRVSRVHCSKYC